MGQAVQTEPKLLTGAEYKRSLQDERRVYVEGELIADVTAHPATAGAVDAIASLYDAQHADESRDVVSYVREDGHRVTVNWMIPRTREDLRRHRENIEFQARSTFGMMGRLPAGGPLSVVSLAGMQPLINRLNPRYADNVVRYCEYAQNTNLLKAGAIVTPQGARPRDADGGKDVEPFRSADGKDMPASSLEVVKETDEGIWLRGVKGVGTLAPQAHHVLVGTTGKVRLPSCHVWASVPLASPGLTVVCRPALSQPSPWQSPVSGRFDESDAMIILEDVFVPREFVFSVGVPEITSHFRRLSVLEHWYTLTRLCVKAELFTGLAQLVVEELGTHVIPGVRQIVSEVILYAQTLRAFVLASEQLAAATEGDTMFPDVTMVTAGRAYGVENYPRILQHLRDLGGPGPLMRFSEADYDHPEYGSVLEWYLSGYHRSAKDKGALMNLLWDLTSDSQAARMEMFERLNAQPGPLLKERLYNEYERTRFVKDVLRFVGVA